jgi:hypothetical protein
MFKVCLSEKSNSNELFYFREKIMRNVLGFLSLAVVFSSNAFSGKCTSEEKAIISFKQSCRSWIRMSEISTGSQKYKDEHCTCAVRRFHMKKIATGSDCDISPSDVLDIFATDAFKAHCE